MQTTLFHQYNLESDNPSKLIEILRIAHYFELYEDFGSFNEFRKRELSSTLWHQLEEANNGKLGTIISISIAYDEGFPVGVATLEYNPIDQSTPFVYNTYVDESYRLQGIGTRLKSINEKIEATFDATTLNKELSYA